MVSRLSNCETSTSPVGWYLAVECVNLYSVSDTSRDHWEGWGTEIQNALFSVRGRWEEVTWADESWLELPATGRVTLAGRPGSQKSVAFWKMLWADAGALGHFKARVEMELVRFLFETSSDEGLAEFTGFWLNKELLSRWDSILG